jgi:ADP-ribose pyrophosphatase
MSAAKKIFEGKHVLVLERDGWEFVERTKGKTAVAVIAMTDDEKIILTEQIRHPVDRRVIDWPAGLVGDEGENDPERTARKELEEETGYTCERIELLASGPTSPGITSEIVSFYAATNVVKTNEGGGVEGEDITVHAIPLRDIETWLRKKERDGVLIDLKIWSGLYFVKSRAVGR